MFKTLLRFAHTLAYGTLTGAYSGYCAGLDGTLVSAVVAVAYLALALDAYRHERCRPTDR